MISLLIRTFHRWIRNDGMGLAAAVSFYSIFAMAPLSLLVVTISGQFVGEMKAQSSLQGAITDIFPNTDATALIHSIQAKSGVSSHRGLSITSAILLLWAASVICTRLQVSVQRIFEQSSESWKTALRKTLLGRLYALGFTMGAGLILALGTVAASVALPLHRIFQLNQSILLETAFTLFLTLGGITLIPLSLHRRPPLGALIKAGVFFFCVLGIGRSLVAQYLLHSPMSSAYGIASSIVVILIWIFFASNFYCFSVALCAELAGKREAGSSD